MKAKISKLNILLSLTIILLSIAPIFAQSIQEQRLSINLPNLVYDQTKAASTACNQLMIAFLCNQPTNTGGSNATTTIVMNCTTPPSIEENALTPDLKKSILQSDKIASVKTIIDSTTSNKYFTPTNVCGGCKIMQTADNKIYWQAIVKLNTDILTELYSKLCPAATPVSDSAMFLNVVRLSSYIDSSYKCQNTSGIIGGSDCSRLFSTLDPKTIATTTLESNNHYCANAITASGLSTRSSTISPLDKNYVCYFNDGSNAYSTVEDLTDELKILSNMNPSDPAQKFRPITYNLLSPKLDNGKYLLSNDGTYVKPDIFFATASTGFLGCRETKSGSQYGFECIAAELSNDSCDTAMVATFPAPYACDPTKSPCSDVSPTFSGDTKDSAHCPSDKSSKSLKLNYPINISS